MEGVDVAVTCGTDAVVSAAKLCQVAPTTSTPAAASAAVPRATRCLKLVCLFSIKVLSKRNLISFD
jgi:hypothetical protein